MRLRSCLNHSFLLLVLPFLTLSGCAETPTATWAEDALNSEMLNARYDQGCISIKQADPGFVFGDLSGNQGQLVAFSVPGCHNGELNVGASGTSYWFVYTNAPLHAEGVSGPRRVYETIAWDVSFTSDGFIVSGRGFNCEGGSSLQACEQRFVIQRGRAVLAEETLR